MKQLKDNGRLEAGADRQLGGRALAEGARATTRLREEGTYPPARSCRRRPRATPSTRRWTPPRSAGSTWSRGSTRGVSRKRSDLVKSSASTGRRHRSPSIPQPECPRERLPSSRAHLDNKAGTAAMLAAIKALVEAGIEPDVDTFWLVHHRRGGGGGRLFRARRGRWRRSSRSTNGVNRAGPELRRGSASPSPWPIQTGPFDYHLTRKLGEARPRQRHPLPERCLPLLPVGFRRGLGGRPRRCAPRS